MIDRIERRIVELDEKSKELTGIELWACLESIKELRKCLKWAEETEEGVFYILTEFLPVELLTEIEPMIKKKFHSMNSPLPNGNNLVQGTEVKADKSKFESDNDLPADMKGENMNPTDRPERDEEIVGGCELKSHGSPDIKICGKNYCNNENCKAELVKMDELTQSIDKLITELKEEKDISLTDEEKDYIRKNVGSEHMVSNAIKLTEQKIKEKLNSEGEMNYGSS